MGSRATCTMQPSQAGRAWLLLRPRAARPDFMLSRCFKRTSHRKGISRAAGTGSTDTSGAMAPPPAIAAVTATGPSPSSAASSAGTTLKQEAQASNQEVYDKLIDVFQQKTPEEWRKLIAFSRQWPSLAQGVLDRVAERASATSDLEEQLALRKFRRRLESVHQELSDYRDLIAEFRQAPSREWESMVVQHRPAMSTPFFDYFELRVRAAHENKPEQEALVALAAQLAALVEAHDRVMRDGEAMDAAADSFGSLLEVDSLEQAERKIDELASSGKLDPALLLTMAKAYAGAKETDITREEVKDLLAHLYFKAKEAFAQQQPPEVRILKYLLTIASPADRDKLMEMAFEQGPQLVTGSQDYLSTTPEALLNTITNVLAVYDQSSGAGTMAGQAAGLMSPEVIATLRDMEHVIRKKYM